MQAMGNDGKWHPWEKLTKDEQEKWMEAMNEAQRRVDYYKANPRPMTIDEELYEYEKKKTVIHY